MDRIYQYGAVFTPNLIDILTSGRALERLMLSISISTVKCMYSLGSCQMLQYM